MSRLAAAANGNWLTAATWALCDSVADLDSEGGVTALTTADQNSSTFVPAAVAIDAILVKLALRAAGVPTNTITITLRNSTTSTDVATLTVNVSDLQVVATNRCGGWYLFKFGGVVTPNGTDSYLIKAKLSATTTTVSLYTNGTVANWCRQLRTTTTQAPVAGDKMIIVQEMTAAGVASSRTVTMNSITTTAYGAIVGTSSDAVASLYIGNGGFLTYAVAAATAYVLRLVGHLVINAGGTLNIGTAGAPMPRDSSGILEFQPTTNVDSGLQILGGTCNVYGLSRTAGKNVVACLMTADAIATATSISVDTDTGWLNTDEIGIASTTRTPSQTESKALSANAGASSIPVAALTNAHLGADAYVKAEVILLTRNTKIRSTSSTIFSYIYTDPTATTHIEWCEFRYLGSNANNERRGVVIDTITGSAVFDRCAHRDGPQYGFYARSLANNWTISNCVMFAGAISSGFNSDAVTTTAWSLINNIFLSSGSGTGFLINSLSGTFTNNTAAGFTTGVNITDSRNPITMPACSGFVTHSCGGVGIALQADFVSLTLTGFRSWRNAGAGITFRQGASKVNTLTLDSWILFGNTSYNYQEIGISSLMNMIWLNCVLAGDTGFATTIGILLNDTQINSKRFVNTTFGVASGLRTTHSTADISFQSVTDKTLVQMVMDNSKLASATRLGFWTSAFAAQDSYVAEGKKDQVSGVHQTQIMGRGVIASETGTTHTASPSEKLTPTTATSVKLESAPKRRAVANGATLTWSVYVQKNSSYAGATARLMLRRNSAAGVTADTVLASMTVAANTWELLSGTTPAVSDDGVLEAFVDCDGVAGSLFVDDWNVTSP